MQEKRKRNGFRKSINVYIFTDNTETTDTEVVKARQNTTSITPEDSQDDVRYKFPSPPQIRKSTTNKTNKVTKITRQRKSSR